MGNFIPLENAGTKYINGLRLTNDGTTPDEIVNIASGAARSSSNNNDIELDAAVDVNNTLSGAGGLDDGSVAADTLYAVYLIGDSSKYNATAGLLSLASNATPSLPFGYDMYRRVGYVLTDATSDFLLFDQRGNSADRTMWYRQAVATDITAGASAAYAAVDSSGSTPSQATQVLYRCTFTPTGANDELHLRSGDSAVAGDSQAVASGSAAGVVKLDMLWCPCGATASTSVDYKVTGSATALNVQAYVDQL